MKTITAIAVSAFVASSSFAFAQAVPPVPVVAGGAVPGVAGGIIATGPLAGLGVVTVGIGAAVVVTVAVAANVAANKSDSGSH